MGSFFNIEEGKGCPKIQMLNKSDKPKFWRDRLAKCQEHELHYYYYYCCCCCCCCCYFPQQKLHCDRGEVGSPSCKWAARTVRVPSTAHHFYCVITCVAPEFFVRASWLVWCARGISSATTYTLQREVLALAANLISLQEWATQCKDWQIRVFFCDHQPEIFDA